MPKKKNEASEIIDRLTPEAALQPANRQESPNSALPAPNIKFVGRDEYDKAKRKILREAAPIDRFSDGGEMFLLPPADFQKRRRLFYHESAARIAATFPTLYKLVRPKRS